eukprot:1229522-Amphidinium_carterae.1
MLETTSKYLTTHLKTGMKPSGSTVLTFHSRSQWLTYAVVCVRQSSKDTASITGISKNTRTPLNTHALY